MKFNSTDEIDTIELKDAKIKDMQVIGMPGQYLELHVEGAVIKANNSQNETYTDRYADRMELRFKAPVIEAVLLEGHKYYDANDKLIEEVPDLPVPEEEYAALFKRFSEQYIFYAGRPEPDRKCYQMIVDVEEASYVISFTYEKLTCGWNHFMNKANMG